MVRISKLLKEALAGAPENKKKLLIVLMKLFLSRSNAS